MIWVLLGTLAFVLFFIYDYNSISYNKGFFRSFFTIGFAFILVSTAGLLIEKKWLLSVNTWRDFIGIAFIILFVILLIYTLFFALPFDDTYVKKSEQRQAYTNGIYAICRHPGVLWFDMAYICVALIGKERIITLYCACVSILNILYVLYQDKIIFPKTFSNYSSYKKNTPFLIPTVRSIKRAVCTLKLSKGGESHYESQG